MTQSQLAKMTELTATTVCRLEASERLGHLETWRRIVAVLPIPAHVILSLTPELDAGADDPTELYDDE